jgi:hypothetical protein
MNQVRAGIDRLPEGANIAEIRRRVEAEMLPLRRRVA